MRCGVSHGQASVTDQAVNDTFLDRLFTSMLRQVAKRERELILNLREQRRKPFLPLGSILETCSIHG